MSGLKTFAVAGAGTIGSFIVDALLNLQKEGKVSSVSLLTRKDTGYDDLIAKGAKRAVVDYASPSLSATLKGVDVVVSALNRGPEVADSQEALARASKEAGVKLFVPSDFGSPTEGSDNTVYSLKEQFKNKFLRELDLPYAVFYTGPMADFVLSPFVIKKLGFDFAEGEIVINGSGKLPISFTARADIASYVAYVLTSLPREKLEWRTFHIEGERLSLNDVADIFVKRLGKKADIIHQPRAVIEEVVKKNPADFPSFLLWSWDVQGGLVADLDKLDNKEYPDWNPKKVEDVIVELHA